MTTYNTDKQYTIPTAFEALNGAIQYYTLTFAAEGLDFTADAQKGNLLRVIELLKQRCSQLIIAEVAAKQIKFTAEQANVFGDVSKKQPSAKSLTADAKAEIEALFASLKAIDGTTSLACTATVANAIYAD